MPETTEWSQHSGGSSVPAGLRQRRITVIWLLHSWLYNCDVSLTLKSACVWHVLCPTTVMLMVSSAMKCYPLLEILVHARNI